MVGDFDGDGRDELIIAPDTTGTAGNDLWAMKFDPAARRWQHISPIADHPFLADINCDASARTTGRGAKFAVVGDFDGNDHLEVVVAPDLTDTAGNDLWAMQFSGSS